MRPTQQEVRNYTNLEWKLVWEFKKKMWRKNLQFPVRVPVFDIVGKNIHVNVVG